MKFGISNNSIIPKAMMVLTFSVFDWKYPFGANLVQNNLVKVKFGT